jgi:putative nucleotidyltransferase with HDIG domain
MRFLPHAIAATFVVMVLPSLVLTLAGPDGPGWVVLLCVLAAMAASLGLAGAGSAIWIRHPRSHDTVFADLMLWGWLRKYRAERRLAEARALLEGGSAAALHGADAETRRDLLERLSAALEARDAYTHGHSKRVTRHAERIARELGLSQELVAKVRIAAAVHDVGKIKTPREVLTKPGRLDDSEFQIIKQHPVDGARMVRDLGDTEITEMVRHHHERLDGTGYPDRLAGDAIPLGARVIAVADTFDAMTSSRPYRAACKHKKALDVLAKEAGTQLDPGAVAAFLRYYSGKRSVGWTALAAAAPQRLGAWLGGVFQNVGAGIASTVQGLSALAAAGVIGAGLGGGAEPTSAEVARNQPGQAAEAAVPGRRNASENRRAASGQTDRRAPGSGDDRRPRDRRGRAERGGSNGTDGPRAGDPGGGRERGGSGGDSDGSGGGGGGGTGSPGGAGDAPGGGGGGGTTTPPGSGGGTGGSAPSITLPDVEVPKVEVPSVEVGPISTPEVETPPVEVPKVEVPSVEVGPIKTPKIETPRVRVPGL